MIDYDDDRDDHLADEGDDEGEVHLADEGDDGDGYWDDVVADDGYAGRTDEEILDAIVDDEDDPEPEEDPLFADLDDD